MDLTFLIVVILMLLAAQSSNIPVVIALFALLMVLAKNKFLMIAAIVGLVLAVVIGLTNFENKSLYMLGGLFLVLVIVAKADSAVPQPYMGGGGYY